MILIRIDQHESRYRPIATPVVYHIVPTTTASQAQCGTPMSRNIYLQVYVAGHLQRADCYAQLLNIKSSFIAFLKRFLEFVGIFDFVLHIPNT